MNHYGWAPYICTHAEWQLGRNKDDNNSLTRWLICTTKDGLWLAIYIFLSMAFTHLTKWACYTWPDTSIKEFSRVTSTPPTKWACYTWLDEKYYTNRFHFAKAGCLKIFQKTIYEFTYTQFNATTCPTNTLWKKLKKCYYREFNKKYSILLSVMSYTVKKRNHCQIPIVFFFKNRSPTIWLSHGN